MAIVNDFSINMHGRNIALNIGIVTTWHEGGTATFQERTWMRLGSKGMKCGFMQEVEGIIPMALIMTTGVTKHYDN
ncbi:MAG: hypothetical protein JXM70_21470 [Pirellulales bacterium]|nr:hypothetical protein [Pirellulales bacterium]